MRGYFRSDDFFYIDEARHTGLWEWLGRVYWEHFAPGHRLAFWLVGSATPTSWHILQLVLVATFAAGLFFFYRALELLYGRSWWLLVPLAITGFAWQFAFGFAWPSAGLQVIPEFAFGTLCLYAFLRHLQSGRWWWLIVSGLAFSAGLAFYVRMLLVPVLLVFIRYVFLERELSVRSVLRGLWLERARWVVFAFPALLYVSWFWRQHVFESPPPENASQVLDYLRIA